MGQAPISKAIALKREVLQPGQSLQMPEALVSDSRVTNEQLFEVSKSSEVGDSGVRHGGVPHRQVFEIAQRPDRLHRPVGSLCVLEVENPQRWEGPEYRDHVVGSAARVESLSSRVIVGQADIGDILEVFVAQQSAEQV